eukprot:3555722-Pyramimonas_sp.AAC.1
MATEAPPPSLEQPTCCQEVKQRLEKNEASRVKLRSTLVLLKVRGHDGSDGQARVSQQLISARAKYERILGGAGEAHAVAHGAVSHRMV